jgi:hypothetical protein
MFHEEYLLACNQELPERWWKAQRKKHFVAFFLKYIHKIVKIQ